MSDEQRINVPKLSADGSNWVVYRDRMDWAMGSRILSQHLTNDAMPAAYGAAGTINGVDAATRWALGEATVKQAIATSVPDSIFTRVKNKTRAKDVWDALKDMFEGRSQMIVVDLRRKLQAMKCGEDEDICAHLSKIADIREQLAAMGTTIPDDKYASILLGSAPTSFESTTSSMNTTAKLTRTVLTPDLVISLITDEFDRCALKKPKEGQEEALGTDVKKGKKPKKDVECFNCKKKGHMKSDCWAKGGGKEGQGPKKRSQDSAATAEKSQQPDIEAWAAIEEIEDEEYGLSVLVSKQPRSKGELYDSGASCHMSPFRNNFVSFCSVPPRPIMAADKRLFFANGIGDLRIRVPNGESSYTPVILRNALYAPEMALTVVSIGRIAKAGLTVAFKGNTCKIMNSKGSVVGKIPSNANGLYKVEHACAATVQVAAEVINVQTLHRRLGHVAPDSIRALVCTQAIQGISLIDDGQPLYCESCEYAKTTRKAIKKEREAAQASAFGDEIHSDLWGPSPLQTLGGHKYYITFTDDYSRYTRIQLLRSKDEALQAYKDFAAWAQTQHGAKIKRLRSDRGGEYTGEEFSKFLKEQGTEHRLTTHDTPQHNGVAESLNRRLLERTRAILHHSGLPKHLWGEAVNHATWLKNRTSTWALGNTTPLERLYGDKPNLGNVPEWGQRVWVHTDSGSKLDARAIEGHWVGYDKDSTHAHRIYFSDKNKVAVERNIKFAPTTVTVYTPPTLTSPTRTIAPPPIPPALPPIPPAARPAPRNVPLPDSEGEEGEEENEEGGWEDEERVDPAPPGQFQSPLVSKNPKPRTKAGPSYAQPTRTSTRKLKPSDYKKRLEAGEGTVNGEEEDTRLGKKKKKMGATAAIADAFTDFGTDYAFTAGLAPAAAAAIGDAQDDPRTIEEARSRSDWPLWQQVMDREMKTLEDAGTWETVPRPTGRNIVGSKWVFRVKHKADGSIDKYKARLVARGFTQIYGTDYFETYSPVAKLTSFRTSVAVARATCFF
jgi:hypothetical protein